MTVRSEHIQLVWDRECAGTAQARSGCSIHVGPREEWTPEQLLVTAAESSLMTIFLRLAAESDLEILGYVSAAEATLDADPRIPPSVLVRPCVVVRREQDRKAVQAALATASELSPIARALGGAVRIDAEVVVVPAAGAT